MHYLLFYEVVDNYPERRKEFRAAHFEYAKRAVADGELVMAGALAEPVDGALLVFRGITPEVARRFAENDPYVRNGLVTAWRVRAWTTVIGDGAELPALDV